jgi:hypothetical protein
MIGRRASPLLVRAAQIGIGGLPPGAARPSPASKVSP